MYNNNTAMCVNILPFYFPALPLPLPLPAFACFMWEIFPAPCGGHFLHFPLGAAQSAYHFSPTKKSEFFYIFYVKIVTTVLSCDNRIGAKKLRGLNEHPPPHTTSWPLLFSPHILFLLDKIRYVYTLYRKHTPLLRGGGGQIRSCKKL